MCTLASSIEVVNPTMIPPHLPNYPMTEVSVMLGNISTQWPKHLVSPMFSYS